MKYSFIVPIYNVEKYLKKCIESLLKQTYENYEIILVNDGSPDNSQAIIEEFALNYTNKCKAFYKENGGLSDARNYGVSKATGDYILFIDSDDYVSKDLLEVINNSIVKNNEDIIRFPKVIVDQNEKIISSDNVNVFENLNGEEAFIKIRKNKVILETACTYAYKKEFWDKNKFEFSKGKLHEDLGLIPYVIMCAKKISAIDKGIYYYVQRKNSITNDKNPEKELKKFKDVLYHFDILIDKINSLDVINKKAKELYCQYIAEAVFIKYKNIDKINKKNFKEEIKKRKVIKYIPLNSLKNFIKRLLYIIY